MKPQQMQKLNKMLKSKGQRMVYCKGKGKVKGKGRGKGKGEGLMAKEKGGMEENTMPHCESNGKWKMLSSLMKQSKIQMKRITFSLTFMLFVLLVWSEVATTMETRKQDLSTPITRIKFTTSLSPIKWSIPQSLLPLNEGVVATENKMQQDQGEEAGQVNSDGQTIPIATEATKVTKGNLVIKKPTDAVDGTARSTTAEDLAPIKENEVEVFSETTIINDIYDDMILWNNSLNQSSTTMVSDRTEFGIFDEISKYKHCLNHRDSFTALLTIALYTIICIVGLFGNTLVIYVVLQYSKMQTVTNIYILNLAIADECFLIGIPFLIYTMRICSWSFGEYMCKAYMVSTSITQFTSSIFLLIMSADRYIAVCHPITSPKYRTIYIAKKVSALAWITSAVLMLPVILYADTIVQEDGIHLTCNIDWPEKYKIHSGTTFILYSFFLGFATPLSFILCFYYLVIRKLHSVGAKHKSKEKKRAHRKVTRLVLTVITVYIFCWLPHWISQVALISSSPDTQELSHVEILVFLLLGSLAYSNSAMNPVLYAFLSENFRKSFSKAFTCMTQQDVNAQLHAEPSVFTKQGSRRRNSRRLQNQQQKLLEACPPAIGNNNSSGTTSSTTTNAEKSNTNGPSTTSTSLNRPLLPNGRTEDVMLVLDHEQAVCTLIDRISPHPHQQHSQNPKVSTKSTNV